MLGTKYTTLSLSAFDSTFGGLWKAQNNNKKSLLSLWGRKYLRKDWKILKKTCQTSLISPFIWCCTHVWMNMTRKCQMSERSSWFQQSQSPQTDSKMSKQKWPKSTLWDIFSLSLLHQICIIHSSFVGGASLWNISFHAFSAQTLGQLHDKAMLQPICLATIKNLCKTCLSFKVGWKH